MMADRLSTEDENKIIEVIKQKIEDASYKELQQAIEFLDNLERKKEEKKPLSLEHWMVKNHTDIYRQYVEYDVDFDEPEGEKKPDFSITVKNEKLYVIEDGKEREIVSATKELFKELDMEEKKPEWNLADEIGTNPINRIDFKTCIQKVKEEMKRKSWTITKDERAHLVIDLEDCDEIIDNLAGEP